MKNYIFNSLDPTLTIKLNLLNVIKSIIWLIFGDYPPNYHNYQIKDCIVNNQKVYYIYNTQKDCDGYAYIKTVENEYMKLRYYRNDTGYGISIEKNDLGLKIRDLLYISGFVV